MEKDIIIQEYSDKYESDIINMILNIQQNEFSIPIQKEDQPDICNISDFYQRGCGNFWIAVIGNEVIGTIALLDIGNGQTALRKMFVKKEYRGRVFEVAHKLLVRLTDWSYKNKVKEIYLGTTDKFLAAHRFYEKNGFVKIDKKKLPTSFPVMNVDTVFYKYT